MKISLRKYGNAPSGHTNGAWQLLMPQSMRQSAKTWRKIWARILQGRKLILRLTSINLYELMMRVRRKTKKETEADEEGAKSERQSGIDKSSPASRVSFVQYRSSILRALNCLLHLGSHLGNVAILTELPAIPLSLAYQFDDISASSRRTSTSLSWSCDPSDMNMTMLYQRFRRQMRMIENTKFSILIGTFAREKMIFSRQT